MGEIVMPPWGVVVVGKWNKSILTPARVHGFLMGKSESVLPEVEIQLAATSPPRVRGDGFTVSVDDDRLYCEVSDRDNYKAVEAAKNVCAKAIGDLPRTPFIAAGVTLTWELSHVKSDAPRATNLKWDEALAKREFSIVRHLGVRVLAWDKARIVVSADRENDDTGIVLINFELRSEDAKSLEAWISKPIDEFTIRAESIIESIREGGLT